MKVKQILYFFTFFAFIRFCNGYQLPIIHKYKKIPQLIHTLDNNPRQKALASIVATHGLTDIFTTDYCKLYSNYFNAFVITHVSNDTFRYLTLFIASIFHFSHDMLGPYKLVQSLFMHSVFLYKPLWCFNYLAYIHTPIHYYKFFTSGHAHLIPFFIFLTRITYFISLKNYNGLWLFPVLGHILCNVK